MDKPYLVLKLLLPASDHHHVTLAYTEQHTDERIAMMKADAATLPLPIRLDVVPGRQMFGTNNDIPVRCCTIEDAQTRSFLLEYYRRHEDPTNRFYDPVNGRNLHISLSKGKLPCNLVRHLTCGRLELKSSKDGVIWTRSECHFATDPAKIAQELVEARQAVVRCTEQLSIVDGGLDGRLPTKWFPSAVSTDTLVMCLKGSCSSWMLEIRHKLFSGFQVHIYPDAMSSNHAWMVLVDTYGHETHPLTLGTNIEDMHILGEDDMWRFTLTDPDEPEFILHVRVPYTHTCLFVRHIAQ